MSIVLNIKTTGVNTLERAAAAFQKQAKAMESTDKAAKKLSSSDQKLVTYFKDLAKQSGMSADSLAKVIMKVKDLEKNLSAVKRISQPFTEMSSQIGRLRRNVGFLNKEMQATAALSADKLGNQQYMTMTQNSKAAILLQKQLNAEIEKQAQIRAKTALADPTSLGSTKGDATLRDMVNNLKLAEVETAKLTAQFEKLGAAEARAAVAARRLAEQQKMVKTGAYQAQLTAINKVQERLQKLGSTKAPTDQLKRMKQDLNQINLELAKTGKLNKTAFVGLRSQLSGLEGKFAETRRGINSVNDATGKWGTNSKYVMGGIARSLGAMTYSYSALLPLIAGIAAGSAVKQVYSLGDAFEYTTTYVDALNDSIGSLKANQIQEGILDIETLRKGPAEISMGLKEFAKAGEDAASSLEQIAEMSKFATLAELELGDAVKLVIGQSRAYGTTYVESANMIAAAALSSATDIQELGTALSYTTELSTVAGTKFHEVATAMAIMANAGVRSSKAGTAIRSSIIRMLNPSEKLKGMLDDLGISWSSFTDDGQIKSVRKMFMELKRITDDLPNKQRVAVLRELFGLRALRGGANLIRAMSEGGKEWDAMNEKVQSASDGLSFISQKYEEVADTVTAKREQLRSEFEKSLLGAYDSQAVKDSLDALTVAVSSDAFIGGLETVVNSLNELAEAISFVVAASSKMGVFKEIFAIDVSRLDKAAKTAVEIMQTVSDKLPEDSWLNKLLKKDLEILDGIKNKVDDVKSSIYESVVGPSGPTQPQDPINAQASKQAAELGIAHHVVVTELKRQNVEIEKTLELQKTHRGIAQELGIAYEGVARAAEVKVEFNAEEAKSELDRALGYAFTKARDDMAMPGVGQALQKEFDKIDFETQLAGMSKWNQVLTKAEQKAKEWGMSQVEALDENHEAVKRLTAGYKEAAAEQASMNLKTNLDAELEKLDFEESVLGLSEWGKALAAAEKSAQDWGKNQVAPIEEVNAAVDKLTKRKKDLLDLQAAELVDKNFAAELEKIDYEKSLVGLKEWELVLKEAEKKALDWGKAQKKALDETSPEVQKLTQEYKELAKAQGLAEVKKATDQLDFYTEYVTSVNEASSAVDKLKAAYAELNVEAYQFTEHKGVDFDSEEGQEYFRALIENSRIFEDAIKSATDKVRDLQEELADTKFDLGSDIFSERQKLQEALNKRRAPGDRVDTTKETYKYQLRQIAQLKKAAKEAGEAGVEGRERQVELLKKAYSIAQGLNTTRDADFLESKMKSAYATMKKYENASNSLKYRSRNEYIKAKQAFEAAKSGDVDVDLQRQKIKEMEALGRAITDSLKKSEGDAQKELDGVKKFAEDAKKAWTSSEEAAKAAAEEAKGYGKIMTKNGETIAEWSRKSGIQIGKVKDKLEGLNAEAQRTSEIFNSGNYEFNVPEKRAAGGPVASNQTYMVGEKGPELFTPGSSGYITPNHELTRSSSKSGTVDLNLNIGGKVIPMGQTPKHSVDDLIRQFEDLDKYSSGG